MIQDTMTMIVPAMARVNGPETLNSQVALSTLKNEKLSVY